MSFGPSASRIRYERIEPAVSAAITVSSTAMARSTAVDHALAFVMAGWTAMAAGVVALLIWRPWPAREPMGVPA
jgi:hypothetical protein